MGYETRLYVVEKYSNMPMEFEGEKYCYCDVIARFNLCKLGVVDTHSEEFAQKKAHNYFYNDDELVTRDLYGDLMREYTIEEMIEMLLKIENYRRIAPCVSMLKGFLEEKAKGNYRDNLKVLAYGY